MLELQACVTASMLRMQGLRWESAALWTLGFDGLWWLDCLCAEYGVGLLLTSKRQTVLELRQCTMHAVVFLLSVLVKVSILHQSVIGFTSNSSREDSCQKLVTKSAKAHGELCRAPALCVTSWPVMAACRAEFPERWRRWMCWSYWRTCLPIRCAARSFRSTAELCWTSWPLPSMAILFIVQHVEHFEAVLCPFASLVPGHSKLTWTMSEWPRAGAGLSDLLKSYFLQMDLQNSMKKHHQPRMDFALKSKPTRAIGHTVGGRWTRNPTL